MTLVKRRTRRVARLAVASAASITLAVGAAVVVAPAAHAAPTQGPTGIEPAAGLAPLVEPSVRNDTSAPLRELAAAAGQPRAAVGVAEQPMRQLPAATGDRGTAIQGAGSGAVDSSAPGGLMPAFDDDFEGVGNVNGVFPPDTNGDVGPDHYMQWVNLSLAVWDKAGTLLLGPVDGNTLFAGFGGPCETTNNGDPIVLYDHLADQWLASQFAFPNGSGAPPYFQCIAISQTGDPTGAWHRYEFQIPVPKINDYPKFGVWPDAYYMAVNQFTPAGVFAGQGTAAFDRDQMLAGQPAQMIYFDLETVNPAFGGQLPADLDGTPPAAGTPNYYVQADDAALSPFATDRLSVWEFHVDFDTPTNSTFGVDGQPNYHLDTAPFDMNMCGFARSCIDQPATTTGLDAISDRLMYRLQYRTFADHATLVVNHTVDTDGTDHAGIRWYELRDTGTGFTIHQQGTHAPDAEHRWMGSAAMDISGNIAIGYSLSSETTFPSIRAAGRLAGDPPGQLTQGETEMTAGTGAQTDTRARWGDYSMLAVDPTDQCTYWYTNQYLTTTSPADWHTRIGHFTFPTCTAGPTGTLTGTVTDADTSDPIQNATVTAGAFTTQTTNDGTYTFNLPVGSYDMTATAFGYQTTTTTSVPVLEDQTTTQNFALTPIPEVIIRGDITDGSGHDWPLYAKVTDQEDPGAVDYTNPFSGRYRFDLPGNATYTLLVEPQYPGYQTVTETVEVGAGNVRRDIDVPVDAEACDAPGYQFGASGLAVEDFNDGVLPDGWSVVDNIGNGQVWQFDNPGGRTNNTGGDGAFAIIDSDNYGSGNSQDTELLTPVIDLSTVADPVIRFNQDFNWWTGGQDELTDVDVSIDGGATWENVFRQQGMDVPGPRQEIVAIPQAGGEPDVQVRFHYGPATFEFWWQVDNVAIGACEPVDGGLVAGLVRDRNTGDGINGASVTSVDNPDETTSTFATPDDPQLADGFYWMFSSLTGQHPFTAAADNYVELTRQADVAANDTTRRNFQLAAGLLTVTPDSVSATMRLGREATRTFTITNEGTAPAEVELTEGGGTFEILGGTGTGNGSVVQHVDGAATVPVSAQPATPGDSVSLRPLPRTALVTDAVAEPGRTVTPVLPAPQQGEVTITHSASQDLIAGNSVACSPDLGFTTTENSYLRTFTLADFGVTSGFDVTSVSFGVEASSPAQPLTVNLYTLDGDFIYDNMTLIGSATITLPPTDLSLVTVPVTGPAPAGSTLVVELDSPDMSGTGRFFVGSNNLGQTAPSYLSSESCELPEPTDTADIGVPDMHIVMNVTGELSSVDVPWLSVNPLTFTLNPGQNVRATVALDGQVAQPGTYTATVNIGENTPYTVDPVDVTMNITPPNNWGKVTGTVTGIACDGSTGPLQDAIVHIQGLQFEVTLTTTEGGGYAYWIGVSNNPLQMIVAASDHIPQTRTARIIPRQTITENFALSELC